MPEAKPAATETQSKKSGSPKNRPTVDELRHRIQMRERSMQRHLEGLKQEATTFNDVNLGGRPVLDYVREQPLLAAGVAAGVGLLAGFVTGMLKREEPEEASEYDLWMGAYLDDLVDDAGSRVARGEGSAEALRRALRQRAPVIVFEPEERPVRRGSGSALNLVVNTALGFGVKFAMDRLTQELTGEDEVVEALTAGH